MQLHACNDHVTSNYMLMHVITCHYMHVMACNAEVITDYYKHYMAITC